MAAKTLFTRGDFIAILSRYDLGTYTHSQAVEQGTVQTTYFVHTKRGRFVFRYYENRPMGSVRFEADLLAYLADQHYPCPRQIKDKGGNVVGLYGGKPYAITEFIDGRPLQNPAAHHWRRLIQKAAELQTLSTGFHSPYTPYRWNYDSDLCRRLAHDRALRINTADAYAKFAWLERELADLDLPASLPKGICHCDFHFSNVLFQGDEFAALIDFDDANYTYLQFDLVGLIEYHAWPHTADYLDLEPASKVVQEYMSHRPLPEIEQFYLYDVYKLSILIDCVWFFRRGSAADFREKRKIDFLNSLGRQHFMEAIFA